MSVSGPTGSSISNGMQNSSVQNNGVNDLCQGVSACKISDTRDTPSRLIALPLALITKVISFGSLRDKGKVAETCKSANAASQSALAFEGYGDRALCASLRKLNYPVQNAHFMKRFIHLGPKMHLFQLPTRISRNRLALLSNYMTNIQEAHLEVFSVSTLRRLVQTWPHLERLDVTRFSDFPPACLTHIASCSNLKRLALPQAVGDRDLEVLKPLLQKLEVLKVYGFTFTLTGWSLLATECPNLRVFIYDNFSAIEPKLATVIPQMEKAPSAKLVIYEMFLEGYFKRNEFGKAVRLLVKIMGREESDLATKYVIRMINEGRFKEVERLLAEARQAKIRPNIQIANALFNGYCQSRQN